MSVCRYLAIIALAAILVGCNSTPPKIITVNIADAMCGPKKVQEECGCDLFAALRQAQIDVLSPLASKKLENCVTLKASASIKNPDEYKADIKGCIEHNLELNKDVADKIATIVTSWQPEESQYRRWQACYDKVMNRYNTVVLMDSIEPNMIYCKATAAKGGRYGNHDDIKQIIAGLDRMNIITVLIDRNWYDDEEVIKIHPDLVIIHASAFYPQTVPVNWNARLVQFLDSIKDQTKTKVIVYTRGVVKKGPKAERSLPGAEKRWKNLLETINNPDWKGRIKLVKIDRTEEGDFCFHDPANARKIRTAVRELLKIEF